MGNVDSQWDNGRPHTDKVAREVLDWAERNGNEVYWMWVLGATGEHKEGRALDFMTLTDNQQAYRHRVGEEIAAYLWANRKRLGVWYVIWDRRIISMTYESAGWRKYSGDNPHTDHVHVSFYNKSDRAAYTLPQDDNRIVYPGAAFFRRGKRANKIGRLCTKLRNKGLTDLRTDVWGPDLREAYTKWQQRLGYSGADADGIPGRESWDRLRITTETPISHLKEEPEPKPEPVPEPQPDMTKALSLALRLTEELARVDKELRT